MNDILEKLRILEEKLKKLRELEKAAANKPSSHAQSSTSYPYDQPYSPTAKAQNIVRNWDYTALINGLSDHNGYIRGACLQRLSENCKALPHILLRCNDWVDAIEQDAVRIALELIPRCTLTELYDSIGSLQKLDRSGRISSDAYEQIASMMRTRLSECTNLSSFASLPHSTKTFIYHFLLTGKCLSRDTIFQEYSRERNPFFKRKLLNYLFSTDLDGKELLQQAFSSKFAVIREFAANHLYSQLHDAWPGIEKLLLDPSNKVQEAAAYIVRQHTDISLSTFYSSRLTPDCSPTVIRGLGRYGTKDDLRKLSSMLDHFSGKRLYFAVQAISDGLQSDAEEIYWKCIENSSPKVRKESYKAIATYCNVPPAEIYEKYVASNSPEVQQFLLQILLSHNSWRRLPYTFKIYLSDAPREHKDLLYGSFEQFDEYGSLTKDEADFVLQALDSERLPFSSCTIKRFKFYMKSVTIIP